MEKFIFLIAFTAFALTGQGQSATDTELPKGIIPSDAGLNAIILYPDKHSWRDLDIFYRDVVLSLSEESYYEGLKKATIFHMVKQFGMLENADLRTVEFYTLEQQPIDWVNADVYIKCLEKLKGVWSNDVIKYFCTDKYEKDKAFITKYFGEARWEKEQVKYEPLLQLGKSLSYP
jgi:hypothetical protein